MVADPDLLLLDEPTNHLDVEGVAWLAAYLQRRRADSATITVTHDRWFLDATSTSTWEVADGAVSPFEGGYAATSRPRLNATGSPPSPPPAGTTCSARRARLAAPRRPGADLEAAVPPRRRGALIADEPAPRDDVALVQFAVTRLGKDVLDLESAVVVLGDQRILDDVTWRLAPGERVGVVGVNGAGKSTLVKALLGRCHSPRTAPSGQDRRHGIPQPGRPWLVPLEGCASSRRSPRCAR